MASLYADEDFSYPVVEELRRLGHDVLTAHEAGRANQRIPDPDVLDFACLSNRALLTFNRRHFIRLAHSIPSHSGIIVCTRDDDVLALAQRIHAEISSSPSLANRLIRVYRPG
ncbi:MAG TPA: DUF5615 family PIN-like protein [Gemmataceae bacterium]|jgi:hypothetical protein